MCPFWDWEVVTRVCLLCDDSVGFFVPFSLCLFLHNSLKKKKISESLVKPRGAVGPTRMERLHSHHPEKRRAQWCYLVCSKEVKKSGISCTRERRVVYPCPRLIGVQKADDSQHWRASCCPRQAELTPIHSEGTWRLGLGNVHLYWGLSAWWLCLPRKYPKEGGERWQMN